MKPKPQRRLRNLLLFTFSLLIPAFLAGLAYFSYQGATTFLHPPRFQRPAEENPARYGIAYQDIHLLTEDGLKLSAWYTPADNGAVILVAHGYGSARSAEVHALFARHGYGVVSWDARAHGESEGALCTWGYYEARDVEAALDFALAQDNVEHIGAFGQSMGAATVLKAAAYRTDIEAVAVDSTFPAIEEMVDRVVPFVLMRPFIRFFVEQETGLSVRAARPVEDIPRISPRPVFILQGEADTVIPPDSAQRLYTAAGEPRVLWIGEGAGHVGLYQAMPGEYEKRVIEFFDTFLAVRRSEAMNLPLNQALQPIAPPGEARVLLSTRGTQQFSGGRNDVSGDRRNDGAERSYHLLFS